MDRSKVLAVTVLVVVGACALAWPSGGITATGLWDFQRNVVLWENAVHLSVAAVLMVGGACYARTRNPAILWLAIALAVLSVVVGALVNFQASILSTYPETWLNKAARVANVLSRTSTAVPALVLLSLRLRGRFEWLRVGSLILIGGLFALQCLLIFSFEITWLYRTAIVLETICLSLEILALVAVSWAVAFRQEPIRRLAIAGSKMGISCPRCGLTQEVTLPEGECSRCRLRIVVTLEGDEVAS